MNDVMFQKKSSVTVTIKTAPVSVEPGNCIEFDEAESVRVRFPQAD